MKNTAAPESKQRQNRALKGRFSGHLRVREVSAGNQTGFANQFPDLERRLWVEKALRDPRTRLLAVDKFEEKKWLPIGQAVIDVHGEMAVSLSSRYRGLGLSSTAIRATAQHLREYPLTVLTARIGDSETAAVRAFELAGFIAPTGRPSGRYTLILRDACLPFNVWI